MIINTEIAAASVEIDGREYPVAERTAGLVDRLMQLEQDHIGKPAYKLWLAELELLLGKPACRELFKGGRNENVDRLQLIYAGVMQAFNHTDEDLRTERNESAARQVTDALAPVSELLRLLKGLDALGDRKQIRRN